MHLLMVLIYKYENHLLLISADLIETFQTIIIWYSVDGNDQKVWFGLVLWHINHFRLFNAKSIIYI